MAVIDHLGFVVGSQAIKQQIYIPKYYNPEIPHILNELSKTHTLLQFHQLLRNGHISLSTGDEVGKMAYGTGDIPFVRTSDISNWELKISPKQGVSSEIYEQYANKQDIQEGDIFLVKDGTYLIGQSCMITAEDLPCLYQSHIYKIRVKADSPINKYLLLAALNSPIVQAQLRARQFTADIIDTIGQRIKEVFLPVPKDKARQDKITESVREIIEKRSQLRKEMRKVPVLAEGLEEAIPEQLLPTAMNFYEPESNLGYSINLTEITNDILIPKYYNPNLNERLLALEKTHDLISLRQLVRDKVISWDTGIEVGKMAYGTGSIPFVRTSDISNWEIKADPKQSVSREIYEANPQDVQPRDIFLVRDGTYLVGTNCMITDSDREILYCGGIYKFRVLNEARLDPYLFLALLNTPIVMRQIRSKQFTRDIIDTIGKRIFEVVVPIPKDAGVRNRVIETTMDIVETRIGLRDRASKIAIEIRNA